MPTWIDMIKNELDEINEQQLIEPDAEIEEGDQEVGDAHFDLQRLFTLAMQVEKACMENLIQARFTADKGKKDDYFNKVTELKVKAKIVREIFWISLKDDYSLWDKQSVGIRKGWKVVWNDSGNELPPFFGLLGRLIDPDR